MLICQSASVCHFTADPQRWLIGARVVRGERNASGRYSPLHLAARVRYRATNPGDERCQSYARRRSEGESRPVDSRD